MQELLIACGHVHVQKAVSATEAAQRMCYFLNEITCTAGAEEVIGTSLLQCTK